VRAPLAGAARQARRGCARSLLATIKPVNGNALTGLRQATGASQGKPVDPTTTDVAATATSCRFCAKSFHDLARIVERRLKSLPELHEQLYQRTLLAVADEGQKSLMTELQVVLGGSRSGSGPTQPSTFRHLRYSR